MNCVHVLLQNKVILEELPTGDALVRLLLEVDGLVVTLHCSITTKYLAARGVDAREFHTQMMSAVMFHHGVLLRKSLATSGALAWNPAHHRRLLVANIARCTWLFLATALEVGIEEMLR